ncbi:hypothetical protein BDZ89DRAFT_433953 [Hymenopellis radicata]|nr:hypothetical protein BDZ89DRAFT_433953 [Hymenopellis radicata]
MVLCYRPLESRILKAGSMLPCIILKRIGAVRNRDNSAFTPASLRCFNLRAGNHSSRRRQTQSSGDIYRATFAPRISLHGPGSGAHTHIYIYSTNGQRQTDNRLPSFEKLAISMPLPISYARVQDGLHAGCRSAGDNCEVPIRSPLFLP